MTTSTESATESDWRALLEAFYPPWKVLDDPHLRAPHDQVGEDLRLAEQVRAEPGPGVAGPLYRVWSNRQCLVATRREERLPDFDAAREASEARGWPVVLRDSGGTVVPHLPSSLHLTLLLPRLDTGEPGTDEVYRMLCEPVRQVLTSIGLDTTYGQVPRSFCDGRFNLVSGSRKLAGTAQRWRGGIPGHPVRPGMVMAHLTLWVDGDMVGATRAVNRFLEEAGGNGGFDPAATTTLAEVARASGGPTGSSPDPYGVRTALLAALSR